MSAPILKIPSRKLVIPKFRSSLSDDRDSYARYAPALGFISHVSEQKHGYACISRRIGSIHAKSLLERCVLVVSVR